jgi:2-dehydropantoate 2-reductase
VLDVEGIDSVFSEYVHRNLWNKFMFINGLAGMTAVTHKTLGLLKSTPEAWALLNRVIDEVEALGRASGIDLDGEREDVMGYLDRLGPDTRSSMAVAGGRFTPRHSRANRSRTGHRDARV